VIVKPPSVPSPHSDGPGGRADLAVPAGETNVQAQTIAAPAGKGPKIWLDMDQAALDDAYNQIVYAPDMKQIQARYGSNSDDVRARLGQPKRIAYGALPIEAFDLFSTTRAKAPIVIMVHGGAWRTGSAALYSFMAENFVTAGAHFIALDFNNVDEAKGDVMVMVEQVRSAIATIYRQATSFGGDPERLYLVGHSSGSHLAGVALVTDWPARGLPENIIKGAVLVSGLYDMKPVRLSARSKYVSFTDSNEDALSAQRHLDHWNTPVALLYGDRETPEFQRQTRDFHAALQAAGKTSSLTLAHNYNHFELPETLANPYGLAGRAALQQFGLG
jgi:arylformamidase